MAQAQIKIKEKVICKSAIPILQNEHQAMQNR
jgi:hypothetical protein